MTLLDCIESVGREPLVFADEYQGFDNSSNLQTVIRKLKYTPAFLRFEPWGLTCFQCRAILESTSQILVGIGVVAFRCLATHRVFQMLSGLYVTTS